MVKYDFNVMNDLYKYKSYELKILRTVCVIQMIQFFEMPTAMSIATDASSFSVIDKSLSGAWSQNLLLQNVKMLGLYQIDTVYDASTVSYNFL